MNVGLISDVHANEPALRAVLADMPPVDVIVHAGDAVGYGPHPNAVLSLFDRHDVVSIRGNHDRGLEAPGEFQRRYVPVAVESLRWTIDALDADARAMLAAMPLERRLFDGRVHVAHGAPRAPDEYVHPGDMTADLLGEASVLVLGHTHQQVARGFADGVIVNPGSVGQPRNGDRAAAYAVYDLAADTIELAHVEYDPTPVVEDIEATDLPNTLADRFRS